MPRQPCKSGLEVKVLLHKQKHKNCNKKISLEHTAMQKQYVSRRQAPEKLLNTIGEEEIKKKKKNHNLVLLHVYQKLLKRQTDNTKCYQERESTSLSDPASGRRECPSTFAKPPAASHGAKNAYSTQSNKSAPGVYSYENSYSRASCVHTLISRHPRHPMTEKASVALDESRGCDTLNHGMSQL